MKSYRALMAMEPGLDSGVGKQVMTWARAIPGDEQASPSAQVCWTFGIKASEVAEAPEQRQPRAPEVEKETHVYESRIGMTTECIIPVFGTRAQDITCAPQEDSRTS